MAQNDILMEMLSRRRNRAISIVLALKEREVDPYVSRETGQKLRKVILDQMNELADFAADVCRSLDSGDVVLNEIYLTKLDEVHQAIMHAGSNGGVLVADGSSS